MAWGYFVNMQSITKKGVVMATNWNDKTPCPSCGKGWNAGMKLKCTNCTTLQCNSCYNDSGSGIGGLSKNSWCKICNKETETVAL